MKKYLNFKGLSLFAIIVVISLQTVEGQNTQYFRHYTDNGSRGPSAVISLPDGKLLIAGSAKETSSDSSLAHPFIYKTDVNGIIINQIDIPCTTHNLVVNGVHQQEAGNQLILVCRKSLPDSVLSGTDSTTIITVDENLNIINTTSYPFVAGRQFRYGVSCLAGNNIYTCWINNNAPGNCQLSIHKINLTTKTMQSSYLFSDTMSLARAWNIEINNADSLLYLRYSGDHNIFEPTINDGMKLRTAKFDTLLHYCGRTDTSISLVNGVTKAQSPLSPNYFIHGITNNSYNQPAASFAQHPEILKIQSDHIPFAGTDLFLDGDTNTYTGLTTLCMVGNSLISSGYFNCFPIQMPWQHSRSWVYLTKLDTNLTVENVRLFGDDYFYMVYDATETSDGGIAVTGTWYDYHGSQQISNVFVLKTDRDLSYGISEPDNHAIKFHVYPNPANNFIIAENKTAVENAEIRLYSSNGKLVLVRNLKQSCETIPLSGILAGTYIAVINSGKEIIQTQIIEIMNQ